MAKTEFEVAQPDGKFQAFNLEVAVGHVDRCPDCDFIVAVFFPYPEVGHSDHAIVEYMADGGTIRDVNLMEILENGRNECAHCSWKWVRSQAIREPI